jgi:hypothetical protein
MEIRSRIIKNNRYPPLRGVRQEGFYFIDDLRREHLANWVTTRGVTRCDSYLAAAANVLLVVYGNKITFSCCNSIEVDRGAIIGQVAIPVPVLGAVVGGFAGVIAGKGLGNLEGSGVALLINDKD